MKRIIFAAVVAMFIGPALAIAQDPRLGRLDPATRVAVEAVIDSARMLGVPQDPLISKALEGAIKRADGARIVGAVRRLAGHLVGARDALGGGATSAELEAGAAAMMAGATTEDLQRLRAARPRQSLIVPLGVLTDLVARGVPTDSARRVVLALARERLRDEDFVTFRQNVERDIALGAPPGAAISVRINAGAFEQTRADAGPGAGPERTSAPRRP